MFDNYIRPHTRPPIVRVGMQLPKFGHKQRDAKYSFKLGGVSKRGKCHKRWGVWEMFEMQKSCFAKARVKRKFINQKIIIIIIIISIFSKLSKDLIYLPLHLIY